MTAGDPPADHYPGRTDGADAMKEHYRRALEHGWQQGARYRLALPRHVASGLSGLHLGLHAGASLEYKDHRDYQPGDDLRHLDWSAYARSNRLIVKMYRQEVHPRLDLLLDGTASMALDGTAKARAACALAGLLAAAAANAHMTCRTWLSGAGWHPVEPADQPAPHWQGLDFTATDSPVLALHRQPPRWPTRSVRLFLSDLLFEDDPADLLDHLAHHASAAYVVQLLAEADVEPPPRGNLRLVDCESGLQREIFIDATVQQQYRRALAAHQQRWHRACRARGVVMVSLVAERLLAQWNLDRLLESEVLAVI